MCRNSSFSIWVLFLPFVTFNGIFTSLFCVCTSFFTLTVLSVGILSRAYLDRGQTRPLVTNTPYGVVVQPEIPGIERQFYANVLQMFLNLFFSNLKSFHHIYTDSQIIVLGFVVHVTLC
jgi:hypothetical protein